MCEGVSDVPLNGEVLLRFRPHTRRKNGALGGVIARLSRTRSADPCLYFTKPRVDRGEGRDQVGSSNTGEKGEARESALSRPGEFIDTPLLSRSIQTPYSTWLVLSSCPDPLPIRSLLCILYLPYSQLINELGSTFAIASSKYFT